MAAAAGGYAVPCYMSIGRYCYVKGCTCVTTLSLLPRAPLVASRVSLAEQIHSQLKAMIVAGELKAGDLYSVSDLALMFEVSRTPVREAVLQVARDGLLRPERNKGFRVVHPTAQELDDIFQVRLMLEVPAMETVAGLSPAPTAAFARARSIYEQMRRAADKASLVDFLRADREFHLLLIGLCGNEKLTEIIAELRDHMLVPGLHALVQSGHLGPSTEEHLQLLEALEGGDASAARDITSRHVRRTRDEWATGTI